MILKKTFPVNKSSSYELSITLDNVTEYKKGIIKIVNDTTGSLIFLPIKLPNVIFSVKGSMKEYMIYFDTPDDPTISSVSMYALGLDIAVIAINNISFEQTMNKINFTRFRQLNEIEFTKYYLDLFIKYSSKKIDSKLIQKINEEYALFKNPNYFDDFVSSCIESNPELTALDKHKNILEGMYGGKHAVLYLTSSIHDESAATARIKTIAKTINYDDNKYYAILSTKYGYPFDHPEDYYSKKMSLTKIDTVNYIPLWNGKDNYYNNTLCAYIEKYILELIKICKVNGISILHVQNDYINGLVAGYVAKELNIKFIYDVNINEYAKLDNEYFASDMFTLKVQLEKKAMSMADKIIMTPFCYNAYSTIFDFKDDDNLLILPASVDTSKYKEIKENANKIKGIIQTVNSTHFKHITGIRSDLQNNNTQPSKTNIIHSGNRNTTSRVFLGNGITYNRQSSCTSRGCSTGGAMNIGTSSSFVCGNKPANLKTYTYDDSYNDIYGNVNTQNKQKIIHRQKPEASKPSNIASANKLVIGYIGPIAKNHGIEDMLKTVGELCKNHHIPASCVIVDIDSEPLEAGYLKSLLTTIVSLSLEKNVTLVTEVSEHLKWAYVDYIHILYYGNCEGTKKSCDYDLIFQKLVAKGKQIIVTNNVNELYQTSLNEVTCISIKDISELTTTINQLGSDNTKQSNSSNLRSYANSYFSVSALCNKLYDLYDNLKGVNHK